MVLLLVMQTGLMGLFASIDVFFFYFFHEFALIPTFIMIAMFGGRGRKIVAAVEMGYKEASRAIFDANITNVIAAVLMFLFGSGPIRGFAVVLMIGIVTSVFTAVTLTRLWVSRWLRRARPAELNL